MAAKPFDCHSQHTLMDRPSVTEMDRGGVYEMHRQTKCQKMETPLK